MKHKAAATVDGLREGVRALQETKLEARNKAPAFQAKIDSIIREREQDKMLNNVRMNGMSGNMHGYHHRGGLGSSMHGGSHRHHDHNSGLLHGGHGMHHGMGVGGHINDPHNYGRSIGNQLKQSII